MILNERSLLLDANVIFEILLSRNKLDERDTELIQGWKTLALKVLYPGQATTTGMLAGGKRNG